MRADVLIPHGISPTGVGISLKNPSTPMLGLLCPGCGHEFIYKNQDSPTMVCVGPRDEGACREDYPEIFGIPQEDMRWGWNVPMGQVMLLEKADVEIAAWIERWTGLPDVTITIER